MENSIKDVVGYEGLYSVDMDGNVYAVAKDWVTGRNLKRSLPDRKVKLTFRSGYFYAHLKNEVTKKSVLVHRIVAETFIQNPMSKKQVNHIDGNKTNNKVSNLEWCTPGENQKHAYRTGLKKTTEKRNIKVTQKSLDGSIIKTWDSLSMADRHGFDRSAIIRVAKGRQKTSYGCVWEYAL